MIFGHSFYNLESMSAQDLDRLLIIIKNILNSGKITTYLPNNTIEELNNIKLSIEKLDDDTSEKLKTYQNSINSIYEKINEIVEDLKIIDGGSYKTFGDVEGELFPDVLPDNDSSDLETDWEW